MKIGTLHIKGYAALAPMAGVADRAMRELCREFGAAYTVGELTSAKGVSLGDKKSDELLSVSQKERPMGSQLFGNDPDIMAKAAVRAMDFLPDFIDINMGCPAPKVSNNGGGSALMKNVSLAAEIVKAVASAVPVPVTVKMRAGWDDDSKNAAELAAACQAAGAAAITVHGRTRKQMYAPPVDYAIIKKVKETVSVPVIGNGDIFTAQDAADMYAKTGCDFVMVGRGANGAPWIFSQIDAYLKEGRVLPEPPLSERMHILIRQVKLMSVYKHPRTAILESRKHAAWYMKGLRGAAEYRRKCGSISSLEELEELCYRVCRENE